MLLVLVGTEHRGCSGPCCVCARGVEMLLWTHQGTVWTQAVLSTHLWQTCVHLKLSKFLFWTFLGNLGDFSKRRCVLQQSCLALWFLPWSKETFILIYAIGLLGKEIEDKKKSRKPILSVFCGRRNPFWLNMKTIREPKWCEHPIPNVRSIQSNLLWLYSNALLIGLNISLLNPEHIVRKTDFRHCICRQNSP